MNSLINPFLLLGLDVNAKVDIREVKKTYHQLSLLTHPDKGGNKVDFLIVYNAYQYVLKQVENSKEMVEMDILEEDFKNFCLDNKIKELPSLLDIRDETALFNKKFNEQWGEQKIDNPFMDNGYGHLMEESEIVPEEAEEKDDSKIPLTNKFTSAVIKYEEPNALPENYGNFERFDVGEVSNYGNIPENIYDYKETHSEKESIPNIDEKIEDKPDDNFEIKLLEKQLERNNLVTEKKKIKLDFK